MPARKAPTAAAAAPDLAPIAAGPAAVPPIAARGELAIVLEGVSYTLVPTFAAIDRIETATGKSLWELTQAALGKTLKISEAAEIVVQCVGQAGWKNDRVGALIYAADGGLLTVIAEVLRPLLLLMMSGGYTAMGERKA